MSFACHRNAFTNNEINILTNIGVTFSNCNITTFTE